MYVYTHPHTHARTHTHTHACAHTHARTHTHTHACAHTHTHTQASTHTDISTMLYIHTSIDNVHVPSLLSLPLPLSLSSLPSSSPPLSPTVPLSSPPPSPSSSSTHWRSSDGCWGWTRAIRSARLCSSCDRSQVT